MRSVSLCRGHGSRFFSLSNVGGVAQFRLVLLSAVVLYVEVLLAGQALSFYTRGPGQSASLSGRPRPSTVARPPLWPD